MNTAAYVGYGGASRHYSGTSGAASSTAELAIGGTLGVAALGSLAVTFLSPAALTVGCVGVVVIGVASGLFTVVYQISKRFKPVLLSVTPTAEATVVAASLQKRQQLAEKLDKRVADQMTEHDREILRQAMEIQQRRLRALLEDVELGGIASETLELISTLAASNDTTAPSSTHEQ